MSQEDRELTEEELEQWADSIEQDDSEPDPELFQWVADSLSTHEGRYRLAVRMLNPASDDWKTCEVPPEERYHPDIDNDSYIKIVMWEQAFNPSTKGLPDEEVFRIHMKRYYDIDV